MKLKYYLRGLGIGIIVTAILMGVATKGKAEMTDEEIKARAAELGMVEQKVLADITNTSVPEIETGSITEPMEIPAVTDKPETTEEPVTTAEPELTPVPTNEPEMTLEPTDEPEMTPEPTNEPEETPHPTEVPEPTNQPTNPPESETATVTLVIKSGETSWSISKNLFEMGLVESASDFDSYLCKNGYDKTIRIGEYDIPKGATYEEIAKLIAR